MLRIRGSSASSRAHVEEQTDDMFSVFIVYGIAVVYTEICAIGHVVNVVWDGSEAVSNFLHSGLQTFIKSWHFNVLSQKAPETHDQNSHILPSCHLWMELCKG